MNNHNHNHQPQNPLHFDPITNNDDFLEHILANLPPSSPWPDLTTNNNNNKPLWDPNETTMDDNVVFPYDNLASKFRNHQITTTAAASPTTKAALMSPGDVDPDILQMLSGNDVVSSSSFKPSNLGGETSASVQSLFNGFTGQALNQLQQFQHPQIQGQSAGGVTNQAQGGSNPVETKPRVRARRGQATDPHSIAERLRRERIAERMKALQELVPNANKTDKASMLDEIIDYVKFLQIQVKLLSMSRLGAAAAVAPLLPQGGGDYIPTNGNQTTTTTTNDRLTMTENQMAKLMERDMGSAMQFLQGKGLCLMPISLANAISTATRSPFITGAKLPSSPSMSVLTVQSAVAGNDSAVKESVTGSKP